MEGNGNKTFTEKELQVLKTFEKVIPKLSMLGKEKLLAFGEGLTFTAEEQEKKYAEEMKKKGEEGVQ